MSIEVHVEWLGETRLVGRLHAAARFGLTTTAARTILREVFAAVSAWRVIGRAVRIKSTTLDAYASAFEHPLMEEAGRAAGTSRGLPNSVMSRRHGVSGATSTTPRSTHMPTARTA